MQRRLGAARAARRARLVLHTNGVPTFPHRTFLKVFGLSAFAGALLLIVVGQAKRKAELEMDDCINNAIPSEPLKS